jgi:predicted nucleotidyltransferase
MGLSMVQQRVIENPLARMDVLRPFCQKWGIAELALFGSVLREDFNDQSDIDVLARFREGVRYTLFDLVKMNDELEAIFKRRVDLIDRAAVEASPNYIRRKIILDSAQVIYAE